MANDSVEMFVALLLVLYIAFAYGNIPPAVAETLSSVTGKIVIAAAIFLLAFVLHPSVTLLLVLATVMSIPGVELYANPGDMHKKASGKNVQARKAPLIDTESKLKTAKMSKPLTGPRPAAHGKPAVRPDPKTEHYQNPFGV